MLLTLGKTNEISRQSMFEICVTAVHQLRAREPILATVLAPLAEEAPSLEGMLARHLWAVLHAPGIEISALSDLFTDVLQAHPSVTMQAHRIAHRLLKDGRADLAGWLANRMSLVLGPDIHPAARLGHGILLDHGAGVVIGETVVIDDNVSIIQNVTLGGTGNETGDRHPKIAQGVMIGMRSQGFGKRQDRSHEPGCRRQRCPERRAAKQRGRWRSRESGAMARRGANAIALNGPTDIRPFRAAVGVLRVVRHHRNFFQLSLSQVPAPPPLS
ncbi:serine O-acetyltransferase [Amaricoccus macauensis]|uniref:serine O-acetyltransferase n=1 Tax=Amaricoccus macauensis TaxID=57001 RepID=UPI003C7BDFF1